MCQFQFLMILCIYMVQNNLKGYKIDFPYDHNHHIILQTKKLTFIYSVFKIIINIIITHLSIFTNIIIFCFCDHTYDSSTISFFGIFCVLKISFSLPFFSVLFKTQRLLSDQSYIYWFEQTYGILFIFVLCGSFMSIFHFLPMMCQT